MTSPISRARQPAGVPAKRPDQRRADQLNRPASPGTVVTGLVEHVAAGMRELCLSELRARGTWGVTAIIGDGAVRYAAYDELAVGHAATGHMTLGLYCEGRPVLDAPLRVDDPVFAQLIVEHAPALARAVRRERDHARARHHGLSGTSLTRAIRAGT
jgi:hypothetical protein